MSSWKILSRARRYATRAHADLDHRRKYSLEPYAVHLQAVAEIVASVTDDWEMIAAAWLHDTVEDTAVTLADLEREFGIPLARLVGELTDISRPSDGNRAFENPWTVLISPRPRHEPKRLNWPISSITAGISVPRIPNLPGCTSWKWPHFWRCWRKAIEPSLIRPYRPCILERKH